MSNAADGNRPDSHASSPELAHGLDDVTELAPSDFARLRRERDNARRLLAEVWSSRSWALTRPLRVLGERLGYRGRVIGTEALASWRDPVAVAVPVIDEAPVASLDAPGPDAALLPATAAIEAEARASLEEAVDAVEAVEAVESVESVEAVEAVEAVVAAEAAEAAEAVEGVAVHLPRPGRTGPQPWPTASDASIDIVCFANIDWSARYQRPQQMMSQFARHGHRVFYIVPSRRPADDAPYSIVEVAPGIYEVALQCPQLQCCYQTVVSAATGSAFLVALERLAADWHIDTALSVVHLPFWAPLTRQLREARGWRIHYDCMDEWIDFPGIGAAHLREEPDLVAEADLVTVTAEALLRKWSPLNPRCLLVRNGVDFEYFAQHCVPNDLLDLGGPVIGFYGALAEWVDFALLAALARRRPDWTLVLVGDVFVTDLADLDALPNVMLCGKRPYADMPRLLYHFDVCLIPFVVTQVTHAVDPVKFYEYVSVGKPVVSVPLEEMRHYAGHVYFAEDAEGFERQIECALRESDFAVVQRRVALARENDWRQRFEATRAGIVALHPTVSVIIISYNNAELTRGCVESLFRNTAYPKLEVIVVDNASSDGSRNYLRYLARSRPAVRVILNEHNAGFAAANNQGLAIASGDVLVLLNNDTVLSRGWLEPLLRALRDPGIGMVGPVTNAVGNEARVGIDYACIDGMQAFVDRHVAERAGRSFDIAMLAMFCVALRRDTLDRVGLLDETFGIGLFEDDDYSRRVQQCGLRTVCIEDAYIHHYGQASFKKLIPGGGYQQLWERNQAYFESKWGAWVPHQPRVAVAADGSAVAAREPDLAAAETGTTEAEARRTTADHWSQNVAGSDAFSPQVYWLAVPEVQARHQRKGCAGLGYPDWVRYCLGEFLPGRTPVARMLSLGCGSGTLERRLHELGAFRQCDGYDIAPGAIARAREQASAQGIDELHYAVLDLESSELPPDHYDAVWFNGSLHHIRGLERTLAMVRRSLRPEGWLFFNEYVGANHFAFDAVQRDAISAAFASIPADYRRSFVAGSWGEVQETVPLPDPEEVRRVDPSEAVRSQDILRVVHEHFDVVACNPCGGSLLQFLLHGIAGNFRPEDPASIRELERLFGVEDDLIERGVLASDFVVVAARPRLLA